MNNYWPTGNHGDTGVTNTNLNLIYRYGFALTNHNILLGYKATYTKHHGNNQGTGTGSDVITSGSDVIT